jgi:molybdopterin guanine dinucleotide-containing S/N-oxide reductase-like protein
MRDDLPNSKLIIFWGWNPAATINGVSTQYYLALAKEKGARIICIEPRFTNSAAIYADEWIGIRPGTDTALAMAMAHVMISEDIYDHHFIDTYTLGFEKFREYVLGINDGQPKNPEWAEDITTIPRDVIVKLARAYASTKPAALMPGVGVGRTAYGEQFHRTTITLASMTGNIGIHGGDAGARAWEAQFGGYPYNNEWFLDFHKRITARDELPYPSEKQSEFRKFAVHRAKIAEHILEGKCKLLFFQALCYLTQYPDANKVARALQIPEFICTVEQHMTPTARYADIILPVCTAMERNDITMGVGAPFIGLCNKVIEPVGESKTHLEIADAIAKHMGFEDLYNTDDEELQKEYLEKCRVNDIDPPDFDVMKREGVYRIELDEPYIAFKREIEDPENNPFPTPSGKIEIYSKEWDDLDIPDLPPIPTYIEGDENWRSPLAKKYPLSLITPHGKLRALGKFDNIPWLRELEIQTVWINTVDANSRGIKNMESVQVKNDRGTIIIKAKVTNRIVPGTVSIESGAWYKSDGIGNDIGGCANTLTSDAISPVGVFQFNTSMVEVVKLDDN